MPAPSLNAFSVVSENHDYPTKVGVHTFRTIDFTSDDLAHALFTTGRAPGDQAKHGYASVFEALHRWSIIPAYVRRDGMGALMRSQLADELDRSEKGSLSYVLGQAMTGIFCRQALGVTHLLHVDRYWAQKSLKFAAKTNSRADLFGTSPQGWVVAEAKGRTNDADKKLVDKLKNQKRSVKTIQGRRPWVAVGCVACFPDSQYRRMRLRTWDPEDSSDDALELEGTFDAFVRAYYEPVMAALNFEDNLDVDSAPGFVTSRFSSVGVTMGLRADLYLALQGTNTSGDATGDFATASRLALGSSYKPDVSLPLSPWSVDPVPGGSNATEMESSPEPGGAPQNDDRRRAEPQEPSHPGTLFPDGTIFQADWDDAIRLDDWAG